MMTLTTDTTIGRDSAHCRRRRLPAVPARSADRRPGQAPGVRRASRARRSADPCGKRAPTPATHGPRLDGLASAGARQVGVELLSLRPPPAASPSATSPRRSTTSPTAPAHSTLTVRQAPPVVHHRGAGGGGGSRGSHPGLVRGSPMHGGASARFAEPTLASTRFGLDRAQQPGRSRPGSGRGADQAPPLLFLADIGSDRPPRSARSLLGRRSPRHSRIGRPGDDFGARIQLGANRRWAPAPRKLRPGRSLGGPQPPARWAPSATPSFAGSAQGNDVPEQPGRGSTCPPARRHGYLPQYRRRCRRLDLNHVAPAARAPGGRRQRPGAPGQDEARPAPRRPGSRDIGRPDRDGNRPPAGSAGRSGPCGAGTGSGSARCTRPRAATCGRRRSTVCVFRSSDNDCIEPCRIAPNQPSRSPRGGPAPRVGAPAQAATLPHRPRRHPSDPQAASAPPAARQGVG